MHQSFVVLILAASALASCARSEDADTKIARNDVDAAPAAANVDSAIEEAVPVTNEMPVAEAIRAKVAADGGLSENAKWLVAHTDLNGDGTDEALAYVMDPMFCGTGGCSLYVLGQKGGEWEVTDVIGPARLPVYRLDPGADSWATLGVTIGGGGAQPAVMTVGHDAKGYAKNPTVAPAKVVVVSGQNPILPDDDGTPLPRP